MSRKHFFLVSVIFYADQNTTTQLHIYNYSMEKTGTFPEVLGQENTAIGSHNALSAIPVA